MNVEMHVEGDPLSLLPTVSKAVRDFDPNLPLQEPMAQQAQFEESISRQRLFSKLSVFFGLLAGLLVATGLYGTLAYRVNNRTVEIGVRLAVGAQREQVLWMILRESLVVAAIGVGVAVDNCRNGPVRTASKEHTNGGPQVVLNQANKRIEWCSPLRHSYVGIR